MGFGYVMPLPTDVGVLFELMYSRIDKSNEIMLMSLIRKMLSNFSCKYHYRESCAKERALCMSAERLNNICTEFQWVSPRN